MTKTITCDCCGEKAVAMQMRNGMRQFIQHNFSGLQASSSPNNKSLVPAVPHTAITVKDAILYFPDELPYHQAFAFVKSRNHVARKFELKVA